MKAPFFNLDSLKLDGFEIKPLLFVGSDRFDPRSQL